MANTTNSPASFSPPALRSRQRHAEWDRRERVAEVVDQVGEKRNAVCDQEEGLKGVKTTFTQAAAL